VKTNPDIKAAVEQKLDEAIDNQFRARIGFRGRNPNSLYGHSGQSCREIQTDYDEEVARWKKALADLS
jgi:hypothetical protein